MLPDLVRQFNPGEDDAGVHEGFEAEHAPDSNLWFCCILGFSTRRAASRQFGQSTGEGTSPEFVEGERPATFAPAEAELVLPDLVRELDSSKDDAGIHKGLEAEHACDSPLDRSVILLDYIV
jgi:hypothetical protein